MIEVVSNSVVDTARIAHGLAEIVEAGDFISLCGPMGAGKTALVKDFAAALGVEERVTSPTFVLVQTYQGRLPIHHADLYRLESQSEVEDLGLAELVDEGGVGIIEWGESAEPLLHRDYLHVSIHPDDEDENKRTFTFLTVGESWQNRELKLRRAIHHSVQVGK